MGGVHIPRYISAVVFSLFYQTVLSFSTGVLLCEFETFPFSFSLYYVLSIVAVLLLPLLFVVLVSWSLLLL